MAEVKKADAVFEGGGVKGIGLVGAIKRVEEEGYRFENVAGTSAGAIVAALVAAGYTALELRNILESLDYRRFQDKTRMNRFPVAGPILSLTLRKGLYGGRFVEGWVRDLLEVKGVHTFGDLVMEAYAGDPRYRYKLRVIASDVTRGTILVLPQDAEQYGADPDHLSVARAVRMSAGIPFFFEPLWFQDGNGGRNYVVDGGVLSNYPVWLFDEEGDEPAWPTFGFKLVEPGEGGSRDIRGPVSLLTALFSTMMEAHDSRYIADHNFARTIPIPTLGVRTTEFDLSREKSDRLFESGYQAAGTFFHRWDFEQYKSRYRHQPPGKRRERV